LSAHPDPPDLIDRRQLAWYCATLHLHSKGLDGLIIPMAICPCQDWEGVRWTDYRPFWVGDHEPMQRQIEQWVCKGANVYVPWCVFKPDTPPSSRGSQKHVLRVLALAADRDADTGKFGASVIDPTYQIVSSRIPSLNFNELYVFDRPLEPGPASELGRDLRKAMGADSGTGDIVRLVRIAGTANFPSFKKIAERNRPPGPQPVRIGDGGSNEPIDHATFAKAVSVSSAPTSVAGCASSVGSEPSRRTIHAAPAASLTLPHDLRDDIARNDTVDRSAHSFHVMMRLFDQGLTNDEVFSLLSQFPGGSAEKFISRGDLAVEIERCRRRWEKGHKAPRATAVGPQPSAAPDRPQLDHAALYGITGEIAQLASQHTEVDPVAVGMTHLTWAGAAFGRFKHYCVGDDVHHARLHTAIVGDSSRARKGTSIGGVKRLWNAADRYLQNEGLLPLRQVPGPMSTGEGIIMAIRDPKQADDQVADGKESDKRLLVLEGEFSAALKAAERSGNTLSAVLRSAWDGVTLSPIIKTDPITATEPHVCIVAHITREELRALLSTTDIWNGFANRFLWMFVRRAKIVPNPQPMADADIERIGLELARLTRHAHTLDERKGRVMMDNQAADHWANVYPELTQDHPGLYGVLTARAEAQVIRLALTFALLDGESIITERHLEAALSIWRYSSDSIKIIFAGADPDPDANKLLATLAKGPMTQSAIGRLFGGHKTRPQLEALLTRLNAAGTTTSDMRQTGGRPEVIWSLVKR
jgi:hypothetical protein